DQLLLEHVDGVEAAWIVVVAVAGRVLGFRPRLADESSAVDHLWRLEQRLKTAPGIVLAGPGKIFLAIDHVALAGLDAIEVHGQVGIYPKVGCRDGAESRSGGKTFAFRHRSLSVIILHDQDGLSRRHQ